MADKPTLPTELAGEIATSGDGRDITQPWIGELQQPRDQRLLGAPDWGAYERIRKDDQVKSCMEQRIRAVVSRPWSVLPGDDEDPRSVEAADKLSDNIQRIGWDRVTSKMLWATFHGPACAELLWEPRDGLIQWRDIRVRHARRFRVDKNWKLRLLTPQAPMGTVVPERKFWWLTAGGTDDDNAYGEGLAEWLYWPTLFKRNGVRFWNIFLDKFSVPTAKGTYPRGATKEQQDKLLAAIMSMATDSGFIVPEGMQVELLQLAQNGADFAAVCRYMDGAIAKIILSQTMTTDNGSSRSQGEVHADVKEEVVAADDDLLSDSFNGDDGPSRWWTDLNYGPEIAHPILVRAVEKEDDLKEAADTDQVLAATGWHRTEESFRDRYGEGYTYRPPSQALPTPARRPEQGTSDDDALPDNVVPFPATALAEAIDAALAPPRRGGRCGRRRDGGRWLAQHHGRDRRPAGRAAPGRHVGRRCGGDHRPRGGDRRRRQADRGAGPRRLRAPHGRADRHGRGRLMAEAGDCTTSLPFLERWGCPECGYEHSRRITRCDCCGAALRCTVERLPVAVCVLVETPRERDAA